MLIVHAYTARVSKNSTSVSPLNRRKHSELVVIPCRLPDRQTASWSAYDVQTSSPGNFPCFVCCICFDSKCTPICKWPPRPHAVAPDREFGRSSAVLHRESPSARKRTHDNLPSSAPTAGAVAYIPGAMVPVRLGSSVAQVSNHLSTTASPRRNLQHPPALFPIVPWRAPLCVRLLRRCTSAGLSWLGV